MALKKATTKTHPPIPDMSDQQLKVRCLEIAFVSKGIKGAKEMYSWLKEGKK